MPFSLELMPSISGFHFAKVKLNPKFVSVRLEFFELLSEPVR